MTFPRLAALNQHWERHPPMQLLIESYLGFKPRRHTDAATLKSLAARFGGGYIRKPPR